MIPASRLAAGRALGDADDFRKTLVDALATVKGRAWAESKVSGFEDLIRKRASEGATRALRKPLLIALALNIVVPPIVSYLWGKLTDRRAATHGLDLGDLVLDSPTPVRRRSR